MRRTVTTTGEMDLLTEATLAELAHHRGPAHLSLFMPTHRAGPETRQDPIRFRNLVSRASPLLATHEGLSAHEADELLAPVRELLDDHELWRHQADGLAVYAAPGLLRTVRVPLALDEEVVVGRRFRLRPLLPLLADDGRFYVLALSQNDVRLCEGTRFTSAELAPGPMPTSMAEALAHEDYEAQLQVRIGGHAGMFHGHGEGDEIGKQALERFFRAVDRGVRARVGRHRRPVVLAAVGYYLPIYRAVSDYPALVDQAVEGNPQGRSPQELHAGAWEIVAPIFASARREAVERLEAGAGTGSTSTDIVEIVGAALAGRIDSLFLADDRPAWGRIDHGPPIVVDLHDEPQRGDDDLLELAATETLLTGGSVYTGDLPASVDGVPAAALLRW